MDSWMADLVPTVVFGLIIIYPVWRVFSRAGLAPALSLLVFVPVVGYVIAYLLLAFLKWPAAGADAAGTD